MSVLLWKNSVLELVANKIHDTFLDYTVYYIIAIHGRIFVLLHFFASVFRIFWWVKSKLWGFLLCYCFGCEISWNWNQFVLMQSFRYLLFCMIELSSIHEMFSVAAESKDNRCCKSFIRERSTLAQCSVGLLTFIAQYLGLSKVANRPTRVTALGSID